MAETIEVQGYMWLADLFRERGWTNPLRLELDGETPGPQLLERLGIPADRVEVAIVNHKACAIDAAAVRPGDRIALVPPGVPGPHRLLLGFKNT